jgi:hypothetical protein
VSSRRRRAASPFRLEPAAPVGRGHVPNVGDGNPAEVRRWRKAPAHQGQFALSIGGDADHGRQGVGENRRKEREIAGQVAPDPEKPAHGVLVASDRIKVAHGRILSGFFRRVKIWFLRNQVKPKQTRGALSEERKESNVQAKRLNRGAVPVQFTVGLKLRGKADHISVNAEDALIAALKVKTRTPRSGDYVRPPTKSPRRRTSPIAWARRTHSGMSKAPKTSR